VSFVDGSFQLLDGDKIASLVNFWRNHMVTYPQML